MKSGIYHIKNSTNGKFYLGSAFNLIKRWSRHRSLLRYSRHPNSYLQAAWNKYGEAAFEFQILEYHGKEKLIEREQAWLDWLTPYDKNIGYNISKTANNDRTGILHTKESKNKMSQSHKGVSFDPAVAQQRNLGNRKFELWPCMKGSHCDCRKCRDTENAQQNERRRNNNLINGVPPKRNLEKWPHALGSACRCDDCIIKFREIDLARYYKRKEKKKCKHPI